MGLVLEVTKMPSLITVIDRDIVFASFDQDQEYIMDQNILIIRQLCHRAVRSPKPHALASGRSSLP